MFWLKVSQQVLLNALLHWNDDQSQVFHNTQKISTMTQSRIGTGSSHKGQKIQSWSQEQMIQALTYYFDMQAPGYHGKVLGYKAVADEYRIPRETFRRRTKGRGWQDI